MAEGIRVATDIGGTFTDLVALYDGQVTAIKSHTVPDDFAQGVFNTLEKGAIAGADIAFFVHGSTIVINTLTQRKGVKTGLITTRGFRDVLEIARGNTPDLFNTYYRKPKPCIPRYLRQEVSERTDHRGNIIAQPAEAELGAALDFFRGETVEALAVCFLHSYANPENEQLALAFIKRQWPGITVLASHQVCREWREYERANTTALAAYILPPADAYLNRLEQGLQEKGLNSAPFIMQSNGGIDSVDSARANPIGMVESGPAGGVLGALAYAKLIDEQNVITLDIGGTTAKCSLIHNGMARITTDYHIEKTRKNAGYPIKTPVIDIVEIGSGGGSIAWLDDAGCLRVGPRSAGSAPGPVAYGLGGRDPTITDANLLTGRINPERFAAGEIKPRLDRVRAAFADIAQQVAVEPIDAAQGVLQLANANMINVLKLVSLNRGHDPRDFSLMAFGGGGALHAVALAEELNIPKVIIPPYSAVFSAWGMLMIDLRRDYINTAIIPLHASAQADIDQRFAELQQEAEREFSAQGVPRSAIYHQHYLDTRYVGQEHTVKLNVRAGTLSIEALTADFHNAHEQEYTFRLDNAVEVVNLHLASFARVEKTELQALPRAGRVDPALALAGCREVVYADGNVLTAQIYARDRLRPGMEISGPAIIEETTGAAVIHQGNRVATDDYGGLHIHLGDP